MTQSLHDALPAGHLHSTSNPARIRVLDHDIVVFRYDTARKMVRNTVLVKDPSATDPDDALGAKPGFDAPSDERRMHRWVRCVLPPFRLCRPSPDTLPAEDN